MFMRALALLSLFAFMLFLPSLAKAQVKAQGHGLYCEKAESTAATQTCLKRHLDSAQTQLNNVYKSLESLITLEKKKELEALQKTWLAYRDAECQWQTENSDNPSLKRINELSCMARVTEDRANILSVANDNIKNIDTVREYGSFPRWMNVVAKESPDTYWKYGQRNGFDLNCDGSDDYVMMGLEPKVSAVEVPTTAEGEVIDIKPQNYNADIVVSLTQNPATGRPVTQKIKFLIGEGEGDNIICNNDVSFKFIPAPPADDNETAEKSCGAKLEIQAKSCPAKTISWTGKDFALEKAEVKLEEKLEDKDNKEKK